MKSVLRPALVLFAALSFICGVLYPFMMTGIGQIIFPQQVAGSLVNLGTQTVGSWLIGQSFSSPNYFWGRPSATAPMPNNASASGGSNLGSLNPTLIDAIKGRIDLLKVVDPDNHGLIPVDLITASASGLDPEISLAAAFYQAGRVARVRNISIDQVRSIITQYQQPQYFGFFGEPRVNVLSLNLALDKSTVRNAALNKLAE